MDLYKTILHKYDINFEEKLPWLICGKTDLIQGWKIHISSTQKEIYQLYSIILPYLKENKIVFKIIANKKLLIQLNDGELGRTQIGKTMTIYPKNQEVAKKIIQFVKAKTDFNFAGPKIATDTRLGSILYCRYGGYNPIIEYDRFGRRKLMIFDPYNNLIEDTYTSNFDLDYYKFPFHRFKFEEHKKKNRLLLNQYLVLDVLKSDPKGQVLRGIDIMDKENIKPVLIKQGIANMLCDDKNRDMIDRLSSQFKLSQRIKDVNIPIPYDLKVYNGNHYLITEYIDSNNLENKVFDLLKGSTFKYSKLSTRKLLIKYAIQLIREVIKLHRQGIIHRDLSAGNILISTNDLVYLSDFELSYDVNSSSDVPFKGGTEGFMSLEQKNEEHPRPEHDVYSIGAIIVLIITGLDPRRVVKGDLDQIRKRLVHLAGREIEIFVDDLLDCFKSNRYRPSLSNLKTKLEQVKLIKREEEEANLLPIQEDEIINTINNVSNLICKEPYTLDYLWFSESLDKDKHVNKNKSSNKTFYGSLNRGIAGVLYVLAHAKKNGFNISTSKTIQNSIRYLKSNYDVNRNKGLLPGLHFGTAGIAVSIANCIKSGILTKSEENISFIKRSLNRKIDWSDYTHGAAGQGMACLEIIRLIGPNKEIELFLQECFQYLISAQKNEGYWEIEKGVDGISGEVMCGFAHGVAGIANFILAYYKNSKDSHALASAKKAAEWLFDNKIDKKEYYEWSFSKKNEEIWNWWCHGAAGISILFLNIYEITKEKKYVDIAMKSINSIPPKPNFSNFSLCHGLSGIGEVYLHAYRITKDKSLIKRIDWVLSNLLNSFIKEDDSFYWLTENPDYPTSDFFVGNGGILYFLIDYYSLFYKKCEIRFPIT